MTRLNTVDPASATGKAKTLLDAVKSKLGLVPNMTRVMANSPATLESYLGFSGALAQGELSHKLREQIALAIAESSECTYCLSAHTVIGGKVGLTPAELAAARRAEAPDAKAAAALRFAKRVAETNGSIENSDVAQVRTAGYSDGQIAEIIAVVALNIFTNIFNKAAAVDVDAAFPRVEPVGTPA